MVIISVWNIMPFNVWLCPDILSERNVSQRVYFWHVCRHSHFARDLSVVDDWVKKFDFDEKIIFYYPLVNVVLGKYASRNNFASSMNSIVW